MWALTSWPHHYNISQLLFSCDIIIVQHLLSETSVPNSHRYLVGENPGMFLFQSCDPVFSSVSFWKLQVSAWFSNMSPYCSQSFSRETTYLIFFSLVRGQVFYFSVMGGDSGAVWPAQDSRGCLWSELCVRCWGSWWCRVWTVRISCWVTCPLACP